MKHKQNLKKTKILIKFIVIFISVIASYYFFISIVKDSIFSFYLNFTAKLSSIILNFFQLNTTTEGSLIYSTDTSVLISFGCEGTEPIIIFLAGLIAIPLPWKNKILPGTITIFLLYFLNLIRIVALFLIQKNYPNQFDSFHIIYFPILFILFSLIGLYFSTKIISQ